MIYLSKEKATKRTLQFLMSIYQTQVKHRKRRFKIKKKIREKERHNKTQKLQSIVRAYFVSLYTMNLENQKKRIIFLIHTTY